MHMHECTIICKNILISTRQSSSHRDELDFTTEESSNSDTSEAVEFTSCQCGYESCVMFSEDHLRYKEYRCPCRTKQLRALSHCISLITSKRTRHIVGATGNMIELFTE
eukprot:752429-Hanusia_phi.AAC.2